jgi:hypothetical protein
MAKKDLLEQAQAAGLAAPDADADDYTEAELKALLEPEKPAWEGSRSSDEPLVAPDGHVNLSAEDIEARQ